MGELITAFTAGLLSFFSPCILPLLPAYLSMLSGFSASEIMKGDAKVATRKVVISALIFIAGFTLTFAAMGAAASGIGGLLNDYKYQLMKALGVMMVLFGVHMTGLINLNFLNYEKRLNTRGLAQGPFGAFFMGLAFALGWSPCIGPILATILGLAAASGTAGKGVLLLVVYSAGMAIPLLIAAAAAAKFFALMARFKTAMRYVEIVAGVVLAAAGVLLFLDKLVFWT